jgi:radical SAM superfamily enzyme YgiQ (UPF0313 family)
MREAGCAQVLIGLESPNATGLEGLELRRNWKAKHWPDYVEAIGRIQRHGIRVNGCFVLGLDGHTTDIFDATLDFARASELFDVQITYLTPFPGTPLYDRLSRSGRLLDPGDWSRCTLFDICYEPDPMSVEELRAGFHTLAKRLYSDEETARRKRVFATKYLRAG